ASARAGRSLPRPSYGLAPIGRVQLKRLSGEHNGLLTIGVAVPLLQYLANMLGKGLSWHDWSARHGGLLLLFKIAVAISVLCILVRRLPPASAAPCESDARPF